MSGFQANDLASQGPDGRVIQVGMKRVGVGPEDLLQATREEFERTHCVLLRDVIEPDLLARIGRMVADSRFQSRADYDDDGEVFSRERTLDDREPVFSLLFWLFNQPKLFETIRFLTGLEARIGHMNGRVYRMERGPGHYDDWHDDVEFGKEIGVSLNLSEGLLQGGGFQIRDRKTGSVHKTIDSSRFGDMHVFRVDPTLQHRVLPVTGPVSRVAWAGWFCSDGDYRDKLRALMEFQLSGESVPEAE